MKQSIPIRAIAAIMLVLVLTGCQAHLKLDYNHTDAASDIVTQYYSEAQIKMLMDEDGFCTFEDLKALSKAYRIECVRDPSIYNDDYLPYVVLLSEDGAKAFVFFDKANDHRIKKVIINDGFLTKQSAGEILDQWTEQGAQWDTQWLPLLKKYDSGISMGAIRQTFCVATKEGLYRFSLEHRHYPLMTIYRTPTFYTDEELFSSNSLPHEVTYKLCPILPIDKD